MFPTVPTFPGELHEVVCHRLDPAPGWCQDGDATEGGPMAEVDKSEKITINVGLVALGQIDLLVDEGFYANRTDFIRTAIRRQLETRAAAVEDTVARRTLILGSRHLGRG